MCWQSLGGNFFHVELESLGLKFPQQNLENTRSHLHSKTQLSSSLNKPQNPAHNN